MKGLHGERSKTCLPASRLAELHQLINILPLVSILSNALRRFDRFELGKNVINISGDLEDSLRVQARLAVTDNQSLQEMREGDVSRDRVSWDVEEASKGAKIWASSSDGL